ncbi:hypothetical protein B14911_08442 [Bacillus sp. NRRL B-14911]|uniref:Uncharacterized protein n=1 Tax=Bacillus infantis NRRL B-14911 TaxID=1367477 RepID=U5LFE8_9BACI|nr:hypothetical protein N288_17610 [Bacillus infantis NRRL B-14911]EAR65266.1 hypothetical protein B14911_08442 [Bacillus sp. NRRL B-14911]
MKEERAALCGCTLFLYLEEGKRPPLFLLSRSIG